MGQVPGLVIGLQSSGQELGQFTEPKGNLDQKVEAIRQSLPRFVMELNEGTASLNADREEMAEKEEERKPLEHEYEVYMTKCEKIIERTFLHDFCPPTVWQERRP